MKEDTPHLLSCKENEEPLERIIEEVIKKIYKKETINDEDLKDFTKEYADLHIKKGIGETGDTGETGKTGDTGDTGNIGKTGETGDIGDICVLVKLVKQIKIAMPVKLVHYLSPEICS
ncbi:hypothetical protein C2G38_2189239 [Gigaspora rosea]|uniref:Collagen triple helix repeat protein n=1 Tax=Gigaspora rosea TaxID=44941 RepID=A0A397V3T2_9GLOM|nr:hypothetical protein C2G38_2189239 [Gigaspora rosea]